MARKNAASSKEQLLEEFQALVSQTEKLLQHSSTLATEKGNDLQDDLNNTLAAARDMLKQAQSGLHKHSKEALESTEDLISKNPLKSISIAAGLGLIVGLLCGRRC